MLRVYKLVVQWEGFAKSDIGKGFDLDLDRTSYSSLVSFYLNYGCLLTEDLFGVYFVTIYLNYYF